MGAAHPEDDRRETILDATCAALAELGFGAVRVADVAQRAGTSTGTIHYYFATKEDLLAAAFTHAAARALERLAATAARIDDPWQRLTVLVEAVLPHGQPVHDDWFVWLAFWAEAVHNPDYAPLNAEEYGRWRQLLAEVIRDGVRRGAFADVVPDDAAAQLAALVDGLAIQALIDADAMPSVRARELSLKAMQALLRP